VSQKRPTLSFAITLTCIKFRSTYGLIYKFVLVKLFLFIELWTPASRRHLWNLTG